MNFVLIGICLLAGWTLRSLNVLPNDAQKGINVWILFIALPAVSLKYVPSITWNHELLLPVAMPMILWGAAWLFVRLTAGVYSMDRPTRAALLLTAGLGNTSFVGFPLTQAYLGDEGLRIAVVCDQITFVALSTVGVLTALHASQNEPVPARIIFKKLFQFPPIIAFVAAIVLPPFVDFAPLNPVFDKLAGTLIPLALFSVGMQIRFSEIKGEFTNLSLGLIYKLLLAPAIIFGLALLFRQGGVSAQTSVFEAAMPPMVTSAILAQEYQLNPRLSSLMVSVGIAVGLLTTAGWSLIVHRLLQQ